MHINCQIPILSKNGPPRFCKKSLIVIASSRYIEHRDGILESLDRSILIYKYMYISIKLFLSCVCFHMFKFLHLRGEKVYHSDVSILRYTLKSRYLEVDGTIFYKFK